MSVSSAMDNSPTLKLLILFAGRIPFLHLQVIKSGDFDQMNHRQADEDSKYNWCHNVQLLYFYLQESFPNYQNTCVKQENNSSTEIFRRLRSI